MIKIISIISMLAVSFVSLQKDDKQKTLEYYKEAIMNSDKKMFIKFADSDFRIGVYEGYFAKYYAEYVLSHSDLPDSLYFGKRYNCDNYIKQEVYYCYSGSKERMSTITFSHNGKILFSDLFDEIFSFNRFGESVKVGEIPFIYENEGIIIEARLNGSSKVFKMLFDTGADGMALVKGLKEEANVTTAEKRNTKLPGGAMSVDFSKGNYVSMGNIRLVNQNMVMFPRMKKGCDGIIGGSNLFRSYITEVDFDKQKIILYSFGKFKPTEEYAEAGLNYSDGMPNLKLQIFSNNNCFNTEFIMDTGAGYEAIMFGPGTKEQNYELLDKHIPSLYYSYNYSLGHKSRIRVARTDSICFANLSFPSATIAIEPYDINKHKEHTVKGSIGIKSLRRFNWIVDLASYKFYTTDNKYSSLPMDFVINGFMFGYDGEKLMVKYYLDKSNLKSVDIENGDEVLKINGIDAKALTYKKLNKIMKGSNVKLNLLRKGKKQSVKLVLL